MLWLVLIFPIIVIVAALLLVLLRRGPFRILAINPENRESAESAGRRMRLRNVTALATGMTVAATLSTVAMVGIGATGQHDFRLHPAMLNLIPILVAIATIGLFALIPTFAETTTARTAQLERRTPRSFAPRSVFLVPLAATALLITIVAWLGIVALPHGDLLFHTYGPGLRYSAGAGFPGFAYGVPVLIAVAALLGAVALALGHVASAPRPTDESLRDADATVRLLAIQTILKTATSAIVLTLAILLISAGAAAEAMGRAMHFDPLTGGPVPSDATLQLIGILGMAGLWCGLCCVVLAITVIVSAISDAMRTPFKVVARAEALA